MLLLFSTRNQKRTGREPCQQEHQGSGVRVLGDLFDGDGEPEDACAGPSILDRDAKAEQTGVAKHLEQVLGVFPTAVDVAGARGHLVLSDPANSAPQLR